MGKNSKTSRQERREQQRLAQKAGSKGKQGNTGVSTGDSTTAVLEDTPPVVVTKFGFKIPAPIIQPEIPVAPPVVVPQVANGKMEGYVLDTAFAQNGNIKWTRVLVDNKGWDIILCKSPAIVMKPGTLISFTPGEWEGRLTVTQPIIIDENTPLAKFFGYCTTKSQKAAIVEVSVGELAKKYMSTNHTGTSDADKFSNFLAGLGILEIIGQLDNGRFIVTQ